MKKLSLLLGSFIVLLTSCYLPSEVGTSSPSTVTDTITVINRETVYDTIPYPSIVTVFDTVTLNVPNIIPVYDTVTISLTKEVTEVNSVRDTAYYPFDINQLDHYGVVLWGSYLSYELDSFLYGSLTLRNFSQSRYFGSDVERPLKYFIEVYAQDTLVTVYEQFVPHIRPYNEVTLWFEFRDYFGEVMITDNTEYEIIIGLFASTPEGMMGAVQYPIADRMVTKFRYVNGQSEYIQ